MLAYIGESLLLISALVLLFQSIYQTYGIYNHNTKILKSINNTVLINFSLIISAYIVLTLAFLTDDFKIAYVVKNSSLALPWYYKLSAVWSSHEGSLLLWIVVLVSWTFAVSKKSNYLPEKLRSTMLTVMGVVTFGFVIFTLFTSNPFEIVLNDIYYDGYDLNPVLQHIGLISHPPILYVGYVGFTVPFAFFIAVMLERKVEKEWIKWVRTWTLIAWAFLGIGIVIGSWWAYTELGWGGWWFWDAVENASLMPWLIGAALIHSLSVTENRFRLLRWSILLSIAAFSLSLIGTFLVRSGLLSSVHAFANDPGRGIYLLIFISLIVIFSLVLFGITVSKFEEKEKYKASSREFFLVINNLLLTVSCVTVFIGTLYPMIMEALFGLKLSVGPPYFNMMFLPFAILMMITLGIGIFSNWNKMEISKIIKTLNKILILSGICSLVLALLFADGSLISGAILALTFWVLLTCIFDIIKKSNKSLSGLLKLKASYWGMHIAHLGIAVCAIGIGFSSQYKETTDFKVALGDSVDVGKYNMSFIDLKELRVKNYSTQIAEISVKEYTNRNQDQFKQYSLMPEKRHYDIQDTITTEASIKVTIFKDVYLILGEKLNEKEWSFRLEIRPFVRWIWLGGVMMAIGSLVSVLDKRYRRG